MSQRDEPVEDPTFGLFEPAVDYDAVGARVRDRLLSTIGVDEGVEGRATSPDLDRSGPYPIQHLDSYVEDHAVSAPRPPRRRAALRAVAIAGAAAAIVAMFAMVWPGTTGGPTPATIDQLAAAAASQPTEPFGPSAPYVQTVEWFSRRGDSILGYTVTERFPGSGPGGTEARSAERIVVDGDDTAGLHLLDPSTNDIPPGAGVFAGFTYAELHEMSTDPQELQTRTEVRLGDQAPPAQVAQEVARLAAIRVAPPDVRATAVRLLGQMGAVVGAGTDPDGRAGTVIAGDGWAVIIDEATGAPLAFAIEPDDAAPSELGDAERWLVWP